MNKSLFYAVLVGSLLCGIGLGRCEYDSLGEDRLRISLTSSMPALDCLLEGKDTAESFVDVVKHSGSVTTTETTKLEEYTPPSGLWYQAKGGAKKAGSWVSPVAKGFATKIVAYQMAFPYGEAATDLLIKGLGMAFACVNPPAAAAFIAAATTLNHTATYFPGGEAVRGLILAPVIEPLVKPAAKTTWWAGGQIWSVASSAWAYCWKPSQTLAPETARA